MASATTLAGSSNLTAACLKNNGRFLGFGIHGLSARRSNVNSTIKLVTMPSISAQLAPTQHKFATGGNVLAGALFAAIASDSTFGADQVLQLAADDNRGLAILFPLLPAVAWVLYNILQPEVNQFNGMKNAKSLAAGLGIGASTYLIVTPYASAVDEIVQIADNDSRSLILLGVLVPAIGWVLFNILQPALNQVNRMRSAKGVAVGLGIGMGAAAASALVFSPQADAAVQELITVAAENNDSRGLVLLGVLIPALGWVLFNILQPALNQINKMRAEK